MTDREMLLVAIREHPEEDTPRLAFADYLQERGNAYFEDWATLIRTQIEATKVERHSARWFELAQQQAELFEKRKLDWDPYSGSGLGCAAYRRGFREAIPFQADNPNFSRHLDLAFAGNPLRAVRLNWNRKSGMREIFQGIARHPGMARVETLDVGNTPPKAARWLLNLAVRHTPRLRAIGLSDLNLTATTAADLLVSLSVPGLAALDLSNNSLFSSNDTVERPESLFHSPTLANVRWLDLEGCGLPVAAVESLAHSPAMRGLRYLNVGGQYSATEGVFGTDGAAALAEGPAMRGLEFLRLSYQRIGSFGLEMLLRSPVLATVRELDLSNNDIGDDGAISLAACPHVARLRKLNLQGNAIGRDGTEALLASPYLTSLRILILDVRGDQLDLTAQLRERFQSVPHIASVQGATFFEPIP